MRLTIKNKQTTCVLVGTQVKKRVCKREFESKARLEMPKGRDQRSDEAKTQLLNEPTTQCF